MMTMKILKSLFDLLQDVLPPTKRFGTEVREVSVSWETSETLLQTQHLSVPTNPASLI